MYYFLALKTFIKSNLVAFYKGYLEMLLLSIITFLSPVKVLVLIAGLLVLLDTIFGIWRSCIKRGERFTSRKFSTFIIKTLIYQFVIITSFTIDYYLLNEITQLFISVNFITTKLITLSVYFTEVKSLEESFRYITGIDIWKNLKDILSRTKEIKEDIEDINN